MIAKLSLILLLALFSFSADAQNIWREMDPINNPSRMFNRFEKRLKFLPSAGKVRVQPWSDTSWPHIMGGAAQRWQMVPAVGPKSYRLLSAAEVSRLSDQDLMRLSPAEKYDIIFGDFTYTTTKLELERTKNATERWFGLCHAAAAAATNFYEPKTISYQVNIAGVNRTVTLFSSDVKALLALAIHYHMSADEIRLGSRCYYNKASTDGACWDANPASLFLALTNATGIVGKGIVLEVDPGLEVWNSAVAGYSAKIRKDNKISTNAAVGTVEQVIVDLSVLHTLGSYPSQFQVGGLRGTKIYRFTLEINAAGEVIGGEWISRDRPDFLWISKIPRLTKLFAPIESMVRRF